MRDSPEIIEICRRVDKLLRKYKKKVIKWYYYFPNIDILYYVIFVKIPVLDFLILLLMTLPSCVWFYAVYFFIVFHLKLISGTCDQGLCKQCLVITIPKTNITFVLNRNIFNIRITHISTLLLTKAQ